MSERPSAQFTADRAPTVDALTDEKDPTVRSYIENLRGQVATIAARYGANARDVFRADVQERMGVDDLTAVAALVKRIGVFGEKKVSHEAARDLMGEMSRREQKAREMLEEAEKLALTATDDPETIVRMLIKSEMAEEADMLASRAHVANPALMSEIYSALARSKIETNPVRARNFIANGWELAKRAWRETDKIQHCLDAYGVRLELSSDAEVAAQQTTLLEEAADMIPVLGERLAIELRRRGITENSTAMNRMREIVEFVRTSVRSNTGLTDDYLTLAELYRENGMRSDAVLREAVEVSRRVPRSVAMDTVPAIADAAGAAGNVALVEELQREDWWREPGRNDNLFVSMEEGMLRGKRFEQVLETLRAEQRNGTSVLLDGGTPYRLIATLVDADQLALAGRVLVEFKDTFGTRYTLWDAPGYAPALARRGDDVLEATRAYYDAEPAIPDERAVAFARVAIATIGFARAMKKRLSL